MARRKKTADENVTDMNIVKPEGEMAAEDAVSTPEGNNTGFPFTDKQQGAVPAMDHETMQAAAAPKKIIREEDIRRAEKILQEYRQESQALRQRIIENELYYEFTSTSGRARVKKCEDMFTKSHSAYLFNTIANKHADFMDNMPSPTILPQEESDEDTAKLLSDIVPCVFEKNNYTAIYSKACYDKLIEGSALYCVMWDGSAENGLGQIKICNAEILNLYWKGGISNLNESPNLFYVSVENNKDLVMRYPQLEGHVGNGSGISIEEFIYEDVPSRENMSLVIDWYYRKPTIMINGAGQRVIKNVLHYCIFCNGVILFASENEMDPDTGMPAYPNGFYEHDLGYPYIMDTLFPIKGSPAGFGYVDISKNPQEFIDELDTAVMDNAQQKSSPRYLVPVGSGVNNEDLRNPKKKILQVSGLTDQFKPIETPDLPGVVLNVREMKVQELKETSGNTDFSQGTTSAGVTAASAIAALQEAGSKLSRDMIKNTYNVYAETCRLVIELMRQFYTIERVFRITQDNDTYIFEKMSSRQLGDNSQSTQFGIAIGGRKPYFDIKVDAQKASPFSRMAQNELAKELYTAGFFNPQLADQCLIALKMMQFEGKDQIVARVSENQTLAMENQQLKQYIVQMSQMLGMTGDANTAAMAQAVAQKFTGQGVTGSAQAGQTNAKSIETDSLGNEQAQNTLTDRAKEKARQRSEVR